MFSLFKSRRKQPRPVSALPKWDLELELLRWSKVDKWTLRDAVEGCAVFGGTGSGKTSGSGKEIRRALLDRANRFGGVVLTAKADEVDLWKSEIIAAGRESDSIEFGPGHPSVFNFMTQEIKRGGAGAGLVENVLRILLMSLEIVQRAGGTNSDGKADDRFFRDAVAELMRACINTLLLSGEDISIANIYRIVMSLPLDVMQAGSQEFLNSAWFYRCLRKADSNNLTDSQRNDLAIDADLFLARFPALSSRTRSSVLAVFTSMTDILNRGILRDLLCSETNFTPEAVEDGKIVLLCMPLKEFGAAGAMFQGIFKFAFQRSIERRDVRTSPRPAFLYIDEAQFFTTSYDFQFLSTCRSARVATVMLSQNISNYLAMLGSGEKGRAEVDSLLALLNTKIFHNIAGDPVTGEYASRLIGRTKQIFCNGNTSAPGSDCVSELLGLRTPGNNPTSAGFSESYEFEVQPRAFSELRTGGPLNDRYVDAIVFQNGRRFRANGRTWLPVTFRQRA